MLEDQERDVKLYVNMPLMRKYNNGEQGNQRNPYKGSTSPPTGCNTSSVNTSVYLP